MPLATLQFLIVMIAAAINDHLQRKFDCAQEKVRVLKEVVHAITGHDKMPFTPAQRRRLATAGKELETCLSISRGSVECSASTSARPREPQRRFCGHHGAPLFAGVAARVGSGLVHSLGSWCDVLGQQEQMAGWTHR